MLIACLEFKGNKILRNAKTHWYSMFGHAKWVLEEYKPLVAKMEVDASEESTTKNNHSMLLDWQNMLTLLCLMSMVHLVNSLIKFAYSPTYSIVNCIRALNICQGDLYQSYIDLAFVFMEMSSTPLDSSNMMYPW